MAPPAPRERVRVRERVRERERERERESERKRESQEISYQDGMGFVFWHACKVVTFARFAPYQEDTPSRKPNRSYCKIYHAGDLSVH